MEITFEFTGGSSDGRIVSTDAEDEQEANWAQAYSHLTEGGQVGKQFMSAFDADILSAQSGKVPEKVTADLYEVVERIEDQGQVVVRVKFVGFN
jgi:hypothetical protein